MANLVDDRLPAWRRYLRFWRSNVADDVHDELEFHLQSTIDELVAAGMSLADARDAARHQFGDVDGVRDTLNTLGQQRERAMARTQWVDAITNDIAYGFRYLRKTPVFATIAVVTLALGIGATSAMFSVVYSVLLRPLPYANADRVLQLSERNGADTIWNLPFGNFDVWRKQARGFDAFGAVWGPSRMTLTGAGEPTAIATSSASAGYWKVLSIPPVIGRYINEAEDRDGGPPAAVLSSALWRNRFGGDPRVIGRTITLNGRGYTVVGVAPPEYILRPPAEQIWIPLAPPAWRLNEFSDHELLVYGLLSRGVAPATAVHELTQVETSLARQHPHSMYDGGVIAPSLVEWTLGGYRSRLYLMLGAVALVLLIACANIANLLLARATVRRTEIAVRSALGASRGRIVAQLLVESGLLGVLGGLLGLGVAAAGVRFLVSAPIGMPRLQDASLNRPVVAFALLLALLCVAVFGLVPALRAARLDLQQTLRDGGRESPAAARDRLRQVLVVGELCVTQVLLVGAGLLIRSSLALQSVPVGFDTHNLLAVSVSLPQSRYPDSTQRENTFAQIERSIASLPGAKNAARAQVAPIYGGGWNWTAKREGSDGHDDGATIADMRFVSPSYFATLSLPLLRGRSFAASDAEHAPPVAIVSRNLAKRLWGDADPVGHRISNGGDLWREVVGVADDMHSDGLRDEAPKVMYIPAAQQSNNGSFTILVRGSVPVMSLLPAMRRTVAAIDPLVPLSGVSTMDQSLANTLATDRFTRWLLSILGGVGLLLAVVGTYGVTGYFVAQRTREIGVRVALGASPRTVRWMVARQGLAMAVVGLAAGLPLSFAGTRLLATTVFGVTPHDPATFVVVGGVLALVAVAASYLPARRATRIDPLEALRST
jgi:predicted permease